MIKQNVTTTITFPITGIGKAAAMARFLPLPIPLALTGLAALTTLATFLIYRRRTRQKRTQIR
jgi:membrane protein implicated in regulation of membrane protease activity